MSSSRSSSNTYRYANNNNGKGLTDRLGRGRCHDPVRVVAVLSARTRSGNPFRYFHQKRALKVIRDPL
jgi:hypothetical protein